MNALATLLMMLCACILAIFAMHEEARGMPHVWILWASCGLGFAAAIMQGMLGLFTHRT